MLLLLWLLFTCGQSHTVQITQLKRDIDTSSEDVSRRDAGQIAQRQAVDDVGSSASTAGVDKIFHGLKGVGSVVFGGDADEKT